MNDPREHCGHLSPETGLSAIRTECVLRPGHSGSHADDVGCRWWPIAEQPAVSSAGPAPATDPAAPRDRRATCPDREPLLGVQCVKEAGHEVHSDRPGRIWYPAPADRAAVLCEAADELGRMDYETDSNDYGYDTYHDAWNGGVMDGADRLRRLAGEPQQFEAGAPWATDGARIGRALIWSWSDIGKGEFGRGYRAAQEEARAILTRALTRGAQQDPTQDGEPVCSVTGCGHDEMAHTVAGCRDCPRGQRAFHLFSLAAVARSGQPETEA